MDITAAIEIQAVERAHALRRSGAVYHLDAADVAALEEQIGREMTAEDRDAFEHEVRLQARALDAEARAVAEHENA